jgi:putative resolvase
MKNIIIVYHQDRLARFRLELIEDLIRKYSGGNITINITIMEKSEKITAEKELSLDVISLDVIQIMNVFIAKINGLRKYKKRNKI